MAPLWICLVSLFCTIHYKWSKILFLDIFAQARETAEKESKSSAFRSGKMALIIRYSVWRQGEEYPRATEHVDSSSTDEESHDEEFMSIS